MTVDPDDTRRCPLADVCDTCGATGELALGTMDTAAGIACVTLCWACAERGALPRLNMLVATALVCEHAQHLGVTIGDLALTDPR